MAQYFANNGWSDITIAFPMNLRELNHIVDLAESIDLSVLVDSKAAVSALQRTSKAKINIWIKIDAGYHRAGIPWDRTDHIISLAKLIQKTPHLNFSGILAHNGQTYCEKNAEGIKRVHAEAMLRLSDAKQELIESGMETCEISIGDTPSCSVLETFNGADEIRPGNFVFYDIIQTMIGSCTDQDIAVAVACPVVGKYRDRGELVIYGGAIHFSKDYIPDSEGNNIFGYVVTETDNSLGRADWQAPLISLSQEHGILKASNWLFDQVNIGDAITIFPVHSCLACNQFPEYLTLEGTIIKKLISTDDFCNQSGNINH